MAAAYCSIIRLLSCHVAIYLNELQSSTRLEKLWKGIRILYGNYIQFLKTFVYPMKLRDVNAVVRNHNS
jgi:hypothetical protein